MVSPIKSFCSRYHTHTRARIRVNTKSSYQSITVTYCNTGVEWFCFTHQVALLCDRFCFNASVLLVTLNGEARPKKLCVKFQYHSDALPFKLYLRMHQQHETLAFCYLMNSLVKMFLLQQPLCWNVPRHLIAKYLWIIKLWEKCALPNVFRFRLLGPVLKSPETLRAYFGCHNFPYIFTTQRFKAIKLRNPLGFSYIKKTLRDQLLKTSGLQFDKCLFGPENFSGLSRIRPLGSTPYLLIASLPCSESISGSLVSQLTVSHLSGAFVIWIRNLSLN